MEFQFSVFKLLNCAIYYFYITNMANVQMTCWLKFMWIRITVPGKSYCISDYQGFDQL